MGSVTTEGAVMWSSSAVGLGGSTFSPMECPAYQILFGVEGAFYLGTDDGAGFCQFKALCSEVRVTADNMVEHIGSVSTVPPAPAEGEGLCATPSGTPLAPLRCPDGQVVVGISTSTSGLFAAPTLLELSCADIEMSGVIGSPSATTDTWGQIVTGLREDHIVDCPNQTVATGIRGTSGGVVVDSLQLECQSVSTGL